MMPSWMKKSLLEMIEQWNLYKLVDEWAMDFLISGLDDFDWWLWIAVNYHIKQEMEREA
jgi:hypothetical protein